MPEEHLIAKIIDNFGLNYEQAQELIINVNKLNKYTKLCLNVDKFTNVDELRKYCYE